MSQAKDKSTTEQFVIPGLKNSLLSSLIHNPPAEVTAALKDLDNLFSAAEAPTNEQEGKVTGKKRNNKGRSKLKGKESSGRSTGTGFGGQQGDNTGMKLKVDLATKEEERSDVVLQAIIEKLRKFMPMLSSSYQLQRKLQDSIGWRTLCFRLLRNDSFLDVGKRMKLYRPFLGVLLQLSKHPSTVEFLSHPLFEEEEDAEEGTDSSIVPTCKQLLTALGGQARVFRQLQGQQKQGASRLSATVQVIELDEAVVMADLIIDTEKAVNSFVDLTDDCALPAASPSFSSSSSSAYGARGCAVDVFDLTGDDDMVMWVSAAQPSSSSSSGNSSSSSSAPSSSSKRQRTLGDSATTAAPTSIGTPSGAAMTAQQEEAQYVKAMLPHRFAVVDMCSLIASGAAQHLYYKSQIGTVANAKQRMTRIAKEMATLSTNLPVEFGSSVLVRVDETRMDLVKALIIGPEGTPYENGCFEFDILLPAQYPQGPPQMLLVTTGRGTVRFNPNLYNCGKVCLSLLGTWAGPGWDAQLSTLLQVLVSIQALILVPDPFFNEPGYEHMKNGAQSEAYNKNIRLQCMTFAMKEQLMSPSPLFADAIRAHFRNKRAAVLRQLQRWAGDSAAHKTAAAAVQKELEKLV